MSVVETFTLILSSANRDHLAPNGTYFGSGKGRYTVMRRRPRFIKISPPPPSRSFAYNGECKSFRYHCKIQSSERGSPAFFTRAGSTGSQRLWLSFRQHLLNAFLTLTVRLSKFRGTLKKRFVRHWSMSFEKQLEGLRSFHPYRMILRIRGQVVGIKYV